MSRIDEIRKAAEDSLLVFINLVHKDRLLGQCHKEVIQWWNRSDAKDHQLLLFPRDHMKSALIAYRVAWEITRNPAIRILYISSTANLAEKQLKFIKDILESPVYQKYWPEMVNKDIGTRERWTTSEISVDHPKRKAEYIRDPTVFTGGLTTNLVGMHCDIAVLDDVVTGDNAYTQEGRDKVEKQYSLLASIEAADAKEWAVGTRYHPNDLYSNMMQMAADVFDEDGELLFMEQVYEIFERAVEDEGDGTGQFLWPRQRRHDGKEFGFNVKILAQKRAKYLDKTQFRAQYYNDPNDSASAAIQRDLFQYYDKVNISRGGGQVQFMGKRLNVFAAVDFAYSLNAKADFTCVTVVGVDGKSNYYILDIDRFKTKSVKEYFDRILALHNKWGFRKIRAEVTAAQAVIVEELKNNYIRPNGVALSVEEHKPNRHMGAKEERMAAILNPRYENKQVWHFVGGNCELLEEELILQNPPHDDIKDSLAAAMEICVAPSAMANISKTPRWEGLVNSRFGGVN